MPLDTTYTVNTPEGISLQLSPVGPASRSWAWGLDVLIRLVIYLMVSSILALTLGNTGKGIFAVFMFMFEWFYPVYFELRNNGQTPGKKVLDIYVAQDDGTPVSLGASVIRNLMRFADFLPLFYGFGLASILLNRKFKRLGDLVAGTVVLHCPPKRRNIVSKKDSQAAICPDFSFTINEQQTLVDFAQRKASLSKERADELARISGDWVSDKDNPADYILGVAKWLEGKRE